MARKSNATSNEDSNVDIIDDSFPKEEPSIAETTERSIERMLTRGQVAKRLKTSVPSVVRAEKRGELVAKVVDGVHYFRIEDVEALEDETETDMGPRDVIEVLVAAVRASNTHVQELVKLVTAPMTKLVDAAASESASLRTRNEGLEKRCHELLGAAEASLNEQHARTLSENEQAAKQRRIDMMLEKVAPHVPDLLTAGIMALRGDSVPTPIRSLLMGLDDAQVMALFESAEKVLRPDQMKLFVAGLEPVLKKAVSKEAAEKGAGNGVAS